MENYSSILSPPIDVLIQIFELTVEECPVPRISSPGTTTLHERQTQAIVLASISRAWRAAALQTPRLWNTILISLDWDPNMVKEYWKWTIQRVKGVPVSLLIYDICEESRMQLEDLDGSSMRFKDMTLSLKHPNDAVLFPATWREYDVGTLKVDVYRQFPGRHGPHESSTLLEFGQFAGRIRRLELHAWEPIPVSATRISNTRLLQLDIEYMQDIDMEGVIKSFPHLEGLYLSSCGVRSLPSAPAATEIQVLHLRRNKSVEWLTKMEAPKLQRLSHFGAYSTSLDEFIKKHSTIATVKLRISSNIDLTKFRLSASQITTLHIVLGGYCEWGSCIALPGAFPALRRLGASDAASNVGPGEVDIIVRARCLPLDHPLSTATSLSRLLEEFFIEIRNTDLYEQFEVYRQATKQIEEDGAIKKIYLSWPMEQN